MLIPVVLSGGKEALVSKDELQFLLDIQQIMLFKRSDGWVALGQNKMRGQDVPYRGEEKTTARGVFTSSGGVVFTRRIMLTTNPTVALF